MSNELGNYLEALERFAGTAIELLNYWNDLTQEEFAKTDSNLYPFTKSFDDLVMDIIAWQEDLDEKLSKD